MVASRVLSSMILWGPPGTGKTTIARLLARQSDLHFEAISAIQSGVADLRKLWEAARRRREAGGGTLLFCDEIHRFNRGQQDSFLPVVEDGTITLVGATTENPSFELNGALLSRCQAPPATSSPGPPLWPGGGRGRRGPAPGWRACSSGGWQCMTRRGTGITTC